MVLVAYAPSLGGGFLNWDDPWLVRDNPLLRRASLADLRAIWTDLRDPIRMALGAEYLPVRDTSLWFESHLHGLQPQLLRGANLLLYFVALLLLRTALLRAIGGWAAEAAIWIFALHPVHVESVAWIAARKDMLALFWIAASLALYASRSRARLLLPFLVALACFSKALAVATPVLLFAHDLIAQRRPSWRPLAASFAVAAAAALVHLHVGGIVGMAAPPVGGSRITSVATMGGVWLRYVQMLVAPTRLSVIYDVTPRQLSEPVTWLGWGLLLIWALWAIHGWRRDRPAPLAGLFWFAAPLLLVSHLFIPLQNLMADRYLLLPAMAPALLLTLLRRPIALGVATTAWISIALPGTIHRSALFADSVALWQDATAHTTTSPIPPYQLALAQTERGDLTSAIASYREALRRAPTGDEIGRRTTSNLAALLVEQGALAEAEQLLRTGFARWPDDPKLLNNLAEVVARQRRDPEARRLYEELLRRFPRYELGIRNYQRRYGAP